ncbi:hypothetical protein ETB97_003900 [Aspergillus alliaceus]|uniref:Uncharacterized protein n=1 Tax=Petromyces alliaceus TaxID=209559 RepID=A0A8H6A126_PETAA|nr:hypothetical protein ETB97_003900 [Aspergillus burnettii]
MNSVTARSLYRPLEWEVTPDMLPVCSVCIQDNDIAELLESLNYSLPYSFLILNPLEFPDPIGEPLEPPVAVACDTNRRLSLNTGKATQPEELSPEDFLKRCRETPKKLSPQNPQNPQNLQDPTGSAARIPEIEKELTNTIGQLTVKNYQIAQLGEEQDSYRNAFTAQQLNRREFARDPCSQKAKANLRKLVGGDSNKFEANADRYDTEIVKKAYLVSRTSGLACQQLNPRLREDTTNPSQSTIEMLDTLTRAFRDAHRQIKAQVELRNLMMKNAARQNSANNRMDNKRYREPRTPTSQDSKPTCNPEGLSARLTTLGKATHKIRDLEKRKCKKS